MDLLVFKNTVNIVENPVLMVLDPVSDQKILVLNPALYPVLHETSVYDILSKTELYTYVWWVFVVMMVRVYVLQ